MNWKIPFLLTVVILGDYSIVNDSKIRPLLVSIRNNTLEIERLLSSFEPDMIYDWVTNKELRGWLKAIARAESNFEPMAVSPAGAEGLMQLMPAIQRHFGVTDPFDPEQSVKAAEALLEEELLRFGSMRLALAAYNAGSPAVKRAIYRAGGEQASFSEINKHLPKETQDYVPKVEGFFELYRIKDRLILV